MLIGNRYELGETIGAGGWGTVYLGLDTTLNEPVAIKHLNIEAIYNAPNAVERFTREAAALRQLDHPNIVKVHATIQEDEQHYIILDYIAGGSLEDKLKIQRQQPVNDVLRLAIEMADALSRAHQLQIVHRDIKPANILFAEDGSTRLTDFGLVHIANMERVTQTGIPMGTTHYIAPEVLNGERIDTRADIWSLGVLLFEALTGQLPFNGRNLTHIITAILTQPVPDLEALRPDVPVALVDLLYRMLTKDRNARIPSMRKIGLELEAIIHGSSVGGLIFADSRMGWPDFSAPIDTSTHNLPAQTTHFVGRQTELTQLDELLADPALRLITIIAPGGMGKTRLALEAAAQHLDTFRDGVYFVPLSSINDAQSIPLAIANAIGYALHNDNRHPHQQLLDMLHDKHMLLILDNYEHLLNGARYAEDILQAAAHVQILATSRERLNLSSETIFDLSGMDVPRNDDLETARQSSAVQLFIQRARRVRPNFRLEKNNVNEIVRICQLVQGLPLGIVLAAAWLDMLAPDEIVTEIEHSLDFLETDLRDLPERQRSIRAVFDHSWALASDEQQQVFMQLTVCQNGFTRQAAQRITGANLRTLTALVNKSFIRRAPDSGRYSIHELLRQYAAEKLRASGQADAARVAHAQYFMQFMQSRNDDLRGKRQLQVLNEIEADFENVVAAWRWAIEQRDVEMVDTFIDPLSRYSEIRGSYPVNQMLFQLAREGLQPVSGESGHRAWWRARVRFDATHFDRYSIQTEPLIQDALERARTADDVPEILYLMMALARYKQHPDRLTLNRQAIALAEANADPYLQEFVYYQQSLTYAAVGELDESDKWLHKALELARERGNQYGISILLNNLGVHARLRENYEQSKAYLNEAITISRQLSDRFGIAWRLNSLCRAAIMMKQFDYAKRLINESLAIAHELDDQRLFRIARTNLFDTHMLAGDYQAARDVAQATYDITLDGNHSDAIIMQWLGQLGVACYALGHVDDAARYLMETIHWHITNDLLDRCIHHILTLSFIIGQRGDYEGAVHILGMAARHPAAVWWQWAREVPFVKLNLRQMRDVLGDDVYRQLLQAYDVDDLVPVLNDLLQQLN